MAKDGQDAIDFNRDIRGVLSDKCFLCHGPDESTREADLRLDVREDAIDFGAIQPGDANLSEIIARIQSDDPDLVMPPPETGKSVTPNEQRRLIQWINQGASYDEHWAFVPPVHPTIPDTENASDGNAIDQFVQTRLVSQRRQRNGPADVITLVRRLHLDLTGLPPTIECLDRFDAAVSAANQAEQIESLIDELLESPQFGERWARWWLDAARYADSAGYEKDMPRQTFFYRDWVIDSMNRDYPYDQFIIDQIAGDLRPGAGQAEHVATGFLRNSMTNEEGGADPEQFRIEGMFDRMDAIGKAILGVTTQCAQCHTHKYDPLSHREYYQMFAALNDFDEGCITVYTPEQADQRQRILNRAAALETELKMQTKDWIADVESWIDTVSATRPHWRTLQITEAPYEGQKYRFLDDGSILSESYAPTKSDAKFSLITDVGTITAVRLDALKHPQLPRGGPGRSIDGTGALSEFKMTVTPIDSDGTYGKPIDIKFVRAISEINPEQRDLKPQYRAKDALADDRVVGPASYAIDGDLKTAWTTDIGPGRSNTNRHIIFVPETPVQVDGRAKLTFNLIQKHGGWNSDDNQNFLIGRYRFGTTDAKSIPETTIDSQVESLLEIRCADWTDRQWNDAFTAYRMTREQWSETNADIESLWKTHPETATQLVAVAREKPRPTYVFARGDFLSPTEEVQTDAPEFLHPMMEDRLSANQPMPDRLRFARWLVDRDSPTTARVIVNRIWQAYFGRGLVKTPEDFGFQSAPPSHPDLLDYLAVELMDSGWSLKHIHRLIVSSNAYRRDSSGLREDFLDDPENQWLARGPRLPMEAEMVRDAALMAGGLLNLKIGGPSVYPPAPEFLFLPPTSYGPKIWRTDQSGDEYRRSVYVHHYRSIPYPPLQIFDAPKGDAACVRRNRSNTPLQALVMLNETQFVESARGLASRVLREFPGEFPCDDPAMDRQRVRYAFRICTSRYPDEDEVAVLIELLQSRLEAWLPEASPDARKQKEQRLTSMLGVSPRVLKQIAGIDARELAAWMTICRTILNLDETVTK
ncbi:MAG: PSD1 and planctomycete cytochrome C domain-containing protein [Planctomycetota bacterium]